jgi:predicted permease
MELMRILWSRCLALFGRSKLDEDLNEELRTHIDLAIEEKLQRGMSYQDARTAAFRDFGGVAQTKERYRLQGGLPLLEVLAQDVRFGFRQLRRSPGFTLLCLATLCLGIGINTAVFSIIQAVLLRPLPYLDPDRLVLLADPQDPQDGGILYKDFQSWKVHSHSFSDMAVYYRDSGWSRVTIMDSREPEAVQGAFVSANFFPLLGIPPVLGRGFTAEEESRHERVAVLSYGLWERRFGGSPDVVGQKIRIDGDTSQIIGVMPASFQFPAGDSQLWAPITTNRYWGDPALNSHDAQHFRGFYARWQAIGRLKDHLPPQEAQAELDTLFSGLERVDPDPDRGSGIKVLPLRVQVNGNIRLALYILFASVCLLLLIACSNVANLVLARGLSRTGEMALRTALGASRGRILQQLLTETVELAALGGLFSLPVAFLCIRGLVALGPPAIPRLQETSLNLGVLGFTFAVALLCAVIFGLAPALRVWRSDPIEQMKSRSAATSDPGGSISLRRFLIVSEFALAVVLLTAAGLLIRSFLIVRAVDPGFEADHVLRVNVSLPGGSSGWPSSLFDSIVAKLQAVPGVKDAGAIDSLFDLGFTGNLGLRSIEGHAPVLSRPWSQSLMKVRLSGIGPVRTRLGNASRGRIVVDRMTTGSPSLASCMTYAHMALSGSPRRIFMSGTGSPIMQLLKSWSGLPATRERLQAHCAISFAASLRWRLCPT